MGRDQQEDGPGHARSSRVAGVVLGWLQPASIPLLAVALGVILGAVLMLSVGANPFEAYKAMLEGALGGSDAFGRTLE